MIIESFGYMSGGEPFSFAGVLASRAVVREIVAADAKMSVEVCIDVGDYFDDDITEGLPVALREDIEALLREAVARDKQHVDPNDWADYFGSFDPKGE